MPTLPNFREFLQSIALAARKNKVDSNDRALLKFDMKPTHFQDAHRKIFSLLANLRTFATHYNGKAAKMRHPQSLAFAASFQTHI
jgi:hypothetical protein